uniref:RING-type domain-containing protein n=1 Tax=viral metagenome TaxID=1070528 RepID=A0A6C0H5F9_9ZZZZ
MSENDMMSMLNNMMSNMSMQNVSEEKVILKCVKENKRLRIKFYSFIDKYGKKHYNVYNKEYNCQFPREIRIENRYYAVPSNAIMLIEYNGKRPFYKIDETNIVILGDIFQRIIDENKNMVVYQEPECVICLSNMCQITYLPCGHKCVCNNCNTLDTCPLCRVKIESLMR